MKSASVSDALLESARTEESAGSRPVSDSLPARVVLRALLASAGQAWRGQFVFRAATWSGIVGSCLQVILVVLVWTAVYGERASVAGITQSNAITYAVLGALTATIFQPFVYDTMYGRLRTGAIAFDVMRPLSAVPMSFAQQVGAAAAQLPAAGIALMLGLMLGAVEGTNSLVSGIAFMISLVLGFSIAQVLNFIVGLVGFWTLEVGGAFQIYRMVSQFSSGALIPLWFMPDWLRGSLTLLPFSSQVFVPISIYIDRSPGMHTLQAIALQAVWIVVLVLLAAIVWRRAIRKLVIFGG